jgi:hypothetical protein
MKAQAKQVFTGLGHETAGKKPSPIEILHRGRRVARLASKEMIGQAVALQYPELVGSVIDETDLTHPEYYTSQTQNIQAQRGTAAVKSVVASVPTSPVENTGDFAQWEREVETAEHFAHWENQMAIPNEQVAPQQFQNEATRL